VLEARGLAHHLYYFLLGAMYLAAFAPAVFITTV